MSNLEYQRQSQSWTVREKGTVRERNAALRLQLVSGIGPKLFGDLIERFGSAEKAIAASPALIRAMPGFGAKLAAEVSVAADSDIDPILQTCHDHQIELLQRSTDAYPARLDEIIDPPPVLFCKGTIAPADQLAVAIVGTRHPTRYGLKVADQLARGLASAGLTIVSGLARGIDAAAHQGALSVGGRTLAVLGGGILKMYPAEHQALADKISKQGAVLSEALPLQPPKSGSFPRRNRIVTGLSLGVIVVEAAQRSGALISARLACEQGRDVFAVPGRMNDRMSKGCNELIRDGAIMVHSVEDVLEQLGPLPCSAVIPDQATGQDRVIRSPAELKLNDQETTILQLVTGEPTEIDWMIQQSGLPASRVLSTISVLEMRHLVRRVSGTAIVRI